MRSIYLDYNATTPLAPAAQEAMLPYLADRFADPVSDHTAGRAVAEAIEDARYRLALAIGASPSEVVWTSGATESCALALRGRLEPALHDGEHRHLVVSAVDHAAVQGPARYLAKLGADLSVLPANGQGVIDPDAVLATLTPSTRLVSIVHADDEVGAVQPIGEITALCRERGVLVHTDAAQSFGKIEVDVEKLGVDLLSLSGHKAYGPKGVGALYVRHGVELEPLFGGDLREEGQRAGMPNVAGAAGMAAAAAVAEAGREAAATRLSGLRDRLAERLLSGANDALVYGPEAGRRLPGTLAIALPGVGAGRLLAATPEVHASVCGDAGGTRSQGALRLSLGWYTDEDDVDAAADALLANWERLRR